MFYMLVFCGCIPAEPGGLLSETECKARVVQMRERGGVRCYSEATVFPRRSIAKP